MLRGANSVSVRPSDLFETRSPAMKSFGPSAVLFAPTMNERRPRPARSFGLSGALIARFAYCEEIDVEFHERRPFRCVRLKPRCVLAR